MSEDQKEERITIIAESFEEAAIEFHRRRLAEKGYRIFGPITPSRFELINGPESESLFDDKKMFAVTFVLDK